MYVHILGNICIDAVVNKTVSNYLLMQIKFVYWNETLQFQLLVLQELQVTQVNQ